MGVVKKIFKWLLLTPLVSCCSLLLMLRLLLQVLRHGRSALGHKARALPPDVLQEPRLGAHGYVYLEEVRIHYVSAGPEDKPLMLLVHGFPEFWYSWRHQLMEFQKDYRVVALDQRGYGDSDKPSDVSSYSMDSLVADIRQLVTALGYRQCVLVGHDWGGLVTWSVAQRCPQLVSRLVILNCPSPLAYSKAGLRQIAKTWYFFAFQVPWLPEQLLQSRDFAFFEDAFLGKRGVRSGHMTMKDVEAYKFIFGRGGFTAPVNYYRQMVRADNFMSPSAQDAVKVSMPTLILWGDRDSVLETRLAELSSQHSVQGGATVRLIEGASHWVQMDRPDLVNHYIREFLSAEEE